jgi:glyoxylase-like metal-dependent hydrolase (beta-lactamase superfamily II)
VERIMKNSLENRVYRVGDAEIMRIVDTQLTTLTAAQLFPAVADRATAMEQVRAHYPEHLSADGQRLLLSVHSWLVRIGGKTILIDTGIGNHKNRPFNALFHQLRTPYLDHLARAGVRPADVDLVLLTHLHVDHVGWNTSWDGSSWRPTFPYARYVYAQPEEDFYHRPESLSRRMIFEDSVLPLIEAGLVDRIDAQGGCYGSHFTFHPTAGHSAGHMSISLSSQGETALFGGDVMHHAVQLLRPDWNSAFCGEGDAARHARAWALRFAAERKALYFSSHFAGSSVVAHASTGAGDVWSFV